MKLVADKLSQRHNLRFLLEQTPGESTTHRFAKLDLKYHSPHAGHVVKGDVSRGEIYYTNSTLINVGAPLNPIERVKREGLFHPLIPAGSISHLWLGESKPSAESLSSFVTKVFQKTQNDQIAFSPEFTTCNQCGQTARGLRSDCPSCGSKQVEGITRITGYFTKVSSWNKGKLGELRDRFRTLSLNAK
jgi:ribonucleoside-triphosphate reductase